MDRGHPDPFRPSRQPLLPALLKAGIIDRPIDQARGFTPEDRAYLIARGIGNTNLVARATARADELTRAELLAGADRLGRFVAEHRPRVVAIAGITAYRTAFGRPRATPVSSPRRWPAPRCGWCRIRPG